MRCSLAVLIFLFCCLVCQKLCVGDLGSDKRTAEKLPAESVGQAKEILGAPGNDDRASTAGQLTVRESTPTPRSDTKASTIGSDIDEFSFKGTVDSLKNNVICKVICLDSQVFPLKSGGVKTAGDIEKFEQHLRTVGITPIDASDLMTQCTSSIKAPCMSIVLGQKTESSHKTSTAWVVLIILIIVAVLIGGVYYMRRRYWNNFGYI
ncbi:hypothetical protein RF11_12200 [Thelohanellus kitauei]|uniref:Uncharacterized protein n=1 Tax=Thelohanellus kitauei TaxID=669202 RepID=A0A0C2JNK5_THEKT|nr:hypothetical protein RF11_12200 [Thelohanellus kitauei]